MEGEEKEKEGKGFIVRDKRHFFQQEEERSSSKEEKGEKPGAEEARLRGEKRKKEAKRKEDEEEKRKEERKEEEKEERKEGQKEGIPFPEITFSNFVFSLTTQALIQLGEIQDPESKEPIKSLPLAKQTIDLIGMLQEKTKGNLTKEEEALINNALYDLRMKYVKASG